MARTCRITGKKPSTGYKVSHSLRHTKRRWLPNLQKKKVLNPLTGRIERIRVSTQALRTLRKTNAKAA
jgi:large subunit ribosomal protein L28